MRFDSHENRKRDQNENSWNMTKVLTHLYTTISKKIQQWKHKCWHKDTNSWNCQFKIIIIKTPKNNKSVNNCVKNMYQIKKTKNYHTPKIVSINMKEIRLYKIKYKF